MTDPIVQMDNPVLRTPALRIDPQDITKVHTKKLIERMKKSLATQNDGVAIAAPQIGEPYAIFVVAPFIFDKPNKAQLIYINPKIIHSSSESKWREEGCLSCRWKIGEVERSLVVTIQAFDEFGNEFTETADGLLAHIFQHETDHLHGTLFVDKARNLRDMTQEEIDEVLNGK